MDDPEKKCKAGCTTETKKPIDLLDFLTELLLGQTILISGSTDFFQNLKGRSFGKKENKPNFLHWL